MRRLRALSQSERVLDIDARWRTPCSRSPYGRTGSPRQRPSFEPRESRHPVFGNPAWDRASSRARGLWGHRDNQFCDFATARPAVRPSFEALSDRSDGRRRAKLGGHLQDLVAADVEAGADGRPAVARFGAGATRQQPQAFAWRDQLTETLDDPGTRDRTRSNRAEESAGEGAVLKCDAAALAGRGIVISDDIGVVAKRKRSPSESRPIGRRRKAREFGAPPAARDRHGEIVGLANDYGPGRGREGVPSGFEAPRGDRRAFQLRLAGDRIGGGADERIDQAERCLLIGPVHRSKQRASPLPLGDDDAQDGAAVGALNFRQVRWRDPDRRCVSRVDFDERLADMRHEPSRLGGAGHRMPLVANAARVEHERIARARWRRELAKRRRDEAGIAIRMIEAPVGEEAPLAWLYSRRARPPEGRERAVILRANLAKRA